jgi:hypothetical protein
MTNVDTTNCTKQYAIIDIKTGRASSTDSSRFAEQIAESRTYSNPCVIIDMHTMQITDVFACDGRLTVGLSGIRFREMKEGDNAN